MTLQTERYEMRWMSMMSIAALLLAACGGGTTTETITNDGRVCLDNPSSSGDGVDPGPIEATVTFNKCLSSTCDTVTSKECTVEMNGDDVVVESSATIEREGDECSADCGAITVTCSGPDLDAGDYTIKHGEKLHPFSLPASGEVCGAGEAPL